MALQDEIEVARATIRTDDYAMSIGEWMNLYQQKELDIHPEFQRFFRWSSTQKTRLIESLLLGIPIPPIFVAQTPDGLWDVVDGLQRLSTIFELAGLLRDEEDELVEPLVLEGTKFLPSLEGKLWETDDLSTSLTSQQRLILKRTKVPVNIILQESDRRAKYELFQRLNTGGSLLSPQEIRNAILVMANRDFYQWIKDLSRVETFQEAIALSDNQRAEQYDIELVTRFVIFSSMRDDELAGIGDLSEFLTDRIVALGEDSEFDRNASAKLFTDVFDYLARSLSSESFRRWDVNKDKFMGGFSVSAYEAVSLGIAANISSLPDADIVQERIKSLWLQEEFIMNSGSGVRASTRIPRIVPFARAYFSRENSVG